VLELGKRWTATETTVLLPGESGTGKELWAANSSRFAALRPPVCRGELRGIAREFAEELARPPKSVTQVCKGSLD